jgi:pilus assembly protein CpaF
MELHGQRRPARAAPVPADPDPFAELKHRVHLAVIRELGPQLDAAAASPDALRERVLADVRDQLAQETGISRDDRRRIAIEIADDILGYGPLERLLADDTVTEIMVNGPHEIWIERQGKLHETSARFNDESHLRRVISTIVARAGSSSGRQGRSLTPRSATAAALQ